MQGDAPGTAGREEASAVLGRASFSGLRQPVTEDTPRVDWDTSVPVGAQGRTRQSLGADGAALASPQSNTDTDSPVRPIGIPDITRRPVPRRRAAVSVLGAFPTSKAAAGASCQSSCAMHWVRISDAESHARRHAYTCRRRMQVKQGHQAQKLRAYQQCLKKTQRLFTAVSMPGRMCQGSRTIFAG
jgi:hypothetical protein